MDRHTAGGRIDQFRLYLLAERGRSPHTAESYASDLRQWLQFCDGAGCPPYPPSPDDVAAFRRDLAAEGKARSTQQRAVAAIRSWMRFVEMEEGSEEDLPLPELPRRTRKEPRILNEAEIGRLLDTCRDPQPLDVRDLAIVELGYGCGLRANLFGKLWYRSY